MIELKGKYNSAKVFTDNVDETTISQVINLLNQPFVENSMIRIMPDTHAGAGCVIGFTALLGDKVVANLVGVDIGCGMQVVNLGPVKMNLEKLDEQIHKCIPAGRNTYSEPVVRFPKLTDICCFRYLTNVGTFEKSIGTLGGGNHFIEVDVDDEDNKYLVIHSGSRNLGKQVADYYQKLAIEDCKGLGNLDEEKKKTIARLKAIGSKQNIQKVLKYMDEKWRTTHPQYPDDLCFLEGDHRLMYLHDMYICQKYASLNRKTIAEEIIGNDIGVYENFETIHNYISFEDNIIRKGAVFAGNGVKLIIPINMRDGSIIATGKGNIDWNNSAPHGAGRLMGRNVAKSTLSMEEYKDTMKDVYTTSVNLNTLDEAPMAYKPMQEILDNIQDTVTVNKIIKPIFNFKAAE